MGKVVKPIFPARCTFGEEPINKVLDDARRAELEIGAVVGITEAGEYHFAFSDGWEAAEVHFLLCRAAAAVLGGGE